MNANDLGRVLVVSTEPIDPAHDERVAAREVSESLRPSGIAPYGF
jgi:hypothetical protein